MTISYTQSTAGDSAPISKAAFLKLVESMPETVADVLRELAQAGDLKNCRTALESGLAEHPALNRDCYDALLPLLSKYPKNGTVKQLVQDWLKKTGGDNQDRLDKALLNEVDPQRAREYLEAGARVGMQNYFNNNAFASAIETNRQDLLHTIITFYNENNLHLPFTKEKGLMDYILDVAKGPEWCAFFLALLGPTDQICEEFRKGAGNALLKRGMTKADAEMCLEMAKFARFEQPQDWDKVSRHLSLFGKPGINSGDNAKHYPAVIENMLAHGLEIDHIFQDMVKVLRNTGLVDFSGTLLMSAAYADDAALVSYLLEKGANPRFYVDCYCAYEISETKPRARQAFDAFAAKQAIEKTLKKQKVAAILYGRTGKSARAQQ